MTAAAGVASANIVGQGTEIPAGTGLLGKSGLLSTADAGASFQSVMAALNLQDAEPSGTDQLTQPALKQTPTLLAQALAVQTKALLNPVKANTLPTQMAASQTVSALAAQDTASAASAQTAVANTTLPTPPAAGNLAQTNMVGQLASNAAANLDAGANAAADATAGQDDQATPSATLHGAATRVSNGPFGSDGTHSAERHSDKKDASDSNTVTTAVTLTGAALVVPVAVQMPVQLPQAPVPALNAATGGTSTVDEQQSGATTVSSLFAAHTDSSSIGAASGLTTNTNSAASGTGLSAQWRAMGAAGNPAEADSVEDADLPGQTGDLSSGSTVAKSDTAPHVDAESAGSPVQKQDGGLGVAPQAVEASSTAVVPSSDWTTGHASSSASIETAAPTANSSHSVKGGTTALKPHAHPATAVSSLNSTLAPQPTHTSGNTTANATRSSAASADTMSLGTQQQATAANAAASVSGSDVADDADSISEQGVLAGAMASSGRSAAATTTRAATTASDPVRTRNVSSTEAVASLHHTANTGVSAADASTLSREFGSQANNGQQFSSGQTGTRASAHSVQNTFAALDAGTGETTSWSHSSGMQRAEAGYQDPVLGWVSVRADQSAGGVHATVVAQSGSAAQALNSQMEGLQAHLASTHSSISSVSVTSSGEQQGSWSDGAASQQQGNREQPQQQAATAGFASAPVSSVEPQSTATAVQAMPASGLTGHTISLMA